jgi:predicted ABC-type transport system involved in lysophospholipase L1 biosynthesis ATPase subunit
VIKHLLDGGGVLQCRAKTRHARDICIVVLFHVSNLKSLQCCIGLFANTGSNKSRLAVVGAGVDPGTEGEISPSTLETSVLIVDPSQLFSGNNNEEK